MPLFLRDDGLFNIDEMGLLCSTLLHWSKVSPGLRTQPNFLKKIVIFFVQRYAKRYQESWGLENTPITRKKHLQNV